MPCAVQVVMAVALLAPSELPQVQFIVAATPEVTLGSSARRLFNAGLTAEDRGDFKRAVQLYMAARLSASDGISGQLYARGSGLRLLRLLAGRDDDAATAAAMVAKSVRFSDLSPLVRMLRRRIGADGMLEMRTGTIASMRFRRATGVVHIELDGDDGERRIISSDAPVAPFSAGQEVRVLVRRHRGKAAAGWRVVAMAHRGASSWQIIRVSGLTGARPTQLLGDERIPRAQFANDRL